MLATPWRKNPKVHHRFQLATGPYSEPVESTPHPPANPPKIHSDPILPSTPLTIIYSAFVCVCVLFCVVLIVNGNYFLEQR
jgi:hypothetical protein